MTLLRHNTYTAEEYAKEMIILEGDLKEISKKMTSYDESEHKMLKYILTFSELLKNANLYYKNALDTERREIVSEVFSELVFRDKKLANYTTKKGYEALFKCRELSSGGQEYLFSELHNIYHEIKKTVERLKHKKCFRQFASPQLMKQFKIH